MDVGNFLRKVVRVWRQAEMDRKYISYLCLQVVMIYFQMEMNRNLISIAKLTSLCMFLVLFISLISLKYAPFQKFII